MKNVLYMTNGLQQLQKKFAAQQAWDRSVWLPARKLQQIRKYKD
jgi:hypothetical protein